MRKEITKKNKKDEFYKEQFKSYKIKTAKFNDFSRGLNLVSELLEKDPKGLASVKLTPLEYRIDLKDMQNNTYKGLSNARIYPDKYRKLRKIIKDKVGDPKTFSRLESWKNVNETLLYDYKKNPFVMIEHKSGLEIYFWSEALEKYFYKQIEEYLKDFLEDILQDLIEDLIEEVVDKLNDIISERRKYQAEQREDKKKIKRN